LSINKPHKYFIIGNFFRVLILITFFSIMNCIIIDDEAGSKQLEEFVSRCSSLNLVGTFNDSFSAVEWLIKRRNIDLAFIDVGSMGPGSFDLIGSLDNSPGMIVVSSTDQYASKAFDYNVIDYLIKPLNYARFTRAVDRTLRINSYKNVLYSDDSEVFIRKDSTLFKLKMNDIVYAEALENYVTLVTMDRKYIIHYTMKVIGKQLPSDLFTRVHRSYIVNKRMIRSINENSLDLVVGGTLKNIPVGKSFRHILLNDINIMEKKNYFTFKLANA